MKHFKCENCGSDLVKCADNAYVCDYCKREYYDDSLEKAYERVYRNLQVTIDGIVSEKLMEQRIEQLANCRQALYKARNGQFIDSKEVEKWSGEILKLSPDDVQANFYGIACKKRWIDLNKFMQKLNARENSYLVEGFVDYLTNGQFVEKCVLALNDLISRAFDENSKEFSNCHKKINKAVEEEESGIFDAELSRDVFVAYSSKDKDEAYKLVEYLEKNGLSCFIAMRNLAKGVDAEHKYNERLKKAIDNCQVFVLVSSKNSRSRDCDAYNIEMRYVKERDISRAENREYANAHYELYLEKNRRRCKPRVEYLIDKYENGLYDKEVKKFFGGLTWCTSLNSVGKVVFDYIENGTVDDEEEKLAKEKAELEKRLAKMKKEKAEADHRAELAKFAREKELEKAKLEAELERARLEAELEKLKKEKQSATRTSAKETTASASFDDLYKAFKERERAEEEERKRQAEEAKRREEERKRKEEFLRQGFQIENGVLKKYVGRALKIVIPSFVTSIGHGAFSDCIFSDVTIPASVTEIGQSAFSRCNSLKSVTIPASVTKIGHSPFIHCERLTDIKVDAKNENYKSLNGVLYTKNGEVLLQYSIGCTAKEFTVPETVVSIGEFAFASCDALTKVILPKSVKEIGDWAFENCESLTEVKNLSSVKTMGSNVFKNSYCLKLSVNLSKAPDGWAKDWNGERPVVWTRSAEVIEANRKAKAEAEAKAKIERERKEEEKRLREEQLRIQRERKELEKKFPTKNGVLTEYNGESEICVVPDFVKDFQSKCFSEAKHVEKVVLPENVTKISNGLFKGLNNLKIVECRGQVTEIGEFAFSGCTKLTEFNIPKTVTFIGKNAFENCSKLTKIDLPNGIKTIHEKTFKGCKGLTGIVIPETVESVGERAFEGCVGLTEIEFSKTITSFGEGVLNKCCNVESVALSYPLNAGNGNFNSFFSYLFGVNLITPLKSLKLLAGRKISGNAFSHLEKVENIEISVSVGSIENSVFKNLKNLTRIEVENGNENYKSIDGNLYTKDGKTLLKYATGKKDKEFKVPDGVVIIECGAFGGVEELERIEIPASTLSIDVLAFEHLTSLNNITVDENNKNYKSIDGNLYVKDGKTLVKVANKQKTEFTIPEGVIVLERDAFSDCKALTKLVIPHSVNRIRSGVFSGCEKLKEIHISNVPAWCNICFEDRSANPLRKNADLYLDGGLVTDLVIPEGVTEIKEYAFDGWSKLQSVSIPASVWKIEDSAFNGCGNLKEVRIQGKKVQMTEETFEGCENLSARSIKSIARQFPLRTKIKLWAVWFRLFLFSFSSLVLEKWESFTERVEDWFDPIWEKIESFMKKVGDLLEPVFSFFDDCCVGISNFAERVSEFIGDISEKRKNLIIAISVGVLLVGGIVAVVLLLEWSVAWIILQCLIGILLGAFVLLTPSSALDYRGAL